MHRTGDEMSLFWEFILGLIHFNIYSTLSLIDASAF